MLVMAQARTMSSEHKEALARGRKEARDIKAYLDALSSRRPGRPVTSSSLTDRLQRISRKLDDESNALKRVDLVQQRLDAEDAIAALADQADFAAIEKRFIASVLAYSARKGITYSAWRESGVSADTLKSAGIPRTRRG